MRKEKVTGYRFWVPSHLSLAAALFGMLILGGCSPRDGNPSGSEPVNSDSVAKEKASGHGQEDADLLMRVRFAGTEALAADTNAAYLTNIASLPETQALGKRIVERFASLPERLMKRGTRNAERGTESGEPTPHPSNGGELLAPMFADLLRDGLILELRGDSNGVTSMTLVGKGDSETITSWNKALMAAAKEWFGGEISAHDGDWEAGTGQMLVQNTNGLVILKISDQQSLRPSTFDPRPLRGTNMLEVQMSSHLLPEPIQRSVYGDFERFSFSATSEGDGFSIQGKASYRKDLPQLGAPPEVPTNIASETVISFSLVRNPDAWLEPESALRRFLPKPIPDVAYFWGGFSTPYQWFMAIPSAGRSDFLSNFGPKIAAEAEALAYTLDSGEVTLETNELAVWWRRLPFVVPRVFLKQSENRSYLVAETFPQDDLAAAGTPAILEEVKGQTNLVLYDWEFTALRYDTWFRIGQLALVLSKNKQLSGTSPSANWVRSVQDQLPNGGNTRTKITQTGPRELSLSRRAPIGFTSIELFWLANWLESENFPRANFLTPATEPDWGEGNP